MIPNSNTSASQIQSDRVNQPPTTPATIAAITRIPREEYIAAR